jgi:hypothetical protein
MATKKAVKSLKTSKIEAPKKAVDQSAPRVLAKSRYTSFRLHRPIKPLQPKLPSGYRILKHSLRTLLNSKRLFIGLTLVYVVLSLLFVRGFGQGVNIPQIKESLNSLQAGDLGVPKTTALLFGVLVTSGNANANTDGGVYQSILLIVMSLATIWALRQVLGGKKITVKDAFYKGLYPLVPFVLVMLVVGVQLIPFALGGWLYTTVISGGIAATALEVIMWGTLVLLLVLLSLYMVASSLFALDIVTLPNMTPMRSLRSARQLVQHRRWVVIRKILFLPFALLVLAAIVMLPFIILLPLIAEWVFFGLSLLGWIITISYMYSLYRELLNE